MGKQNSNLNNFINVLQIHRFNATRIEKNIFLVQSFRRIQISLEYILLYGFS